MLVEKEFKNGHPREGEKTLYITEISAYASTKGITVVFDTSVGLSASRSFSPGHIDEIILMLENTKKDYQA